MRWLATALLSLTLWACTEPAPEAPTDKQAPPPTPRPVSWLVHYEPSAGMAMFMRSQDVSTLPSGLRRAWMTFVYRQERMIFPKPVKSQVILYEFDCEERSHRQLQMEAFAADGTSVDRPLPSDGPFVFVSPQSTQEKVLTLACSPESEWQQIGARESLSLP
jgi:hypothetical protein